MDNSPTDAPLEARFQLNLDDVKAFTKLARGDAKARANRQLIFSMLALFVLTLIVSIIFNRALPTNAPGAATGSFGGPTSTNGLLLLGPVLILVGLIFMGFYWWALTVNKRANARRPSFIHTSTMRLDETGMMNHCDAFIFNVEWRGFTLVAASDGHLGLFTSATEGYMVPRRAFDSDDDWQRFVNFAREHWQQTQPAIPPIANA